MSKKTLQILQHIVQKLRISKLQPYNNKTNKKSTTIILLPFIVFVLPRELYFCFPSSSVPLKVDIDTK